MQKIKSVVLVCSAAALLAAGCNPFVKSSLAGVIRTVNGGADWQFSNVIAESKDTLNGVSVSELKFEPGNLEHLFLGSYTTGLYKSEDSRQSWRQILSKIAVYDFAIHTFDTNIIYVAGYYDEHGKVLITRDGGKAWEEIYNEEIAVNAVRSIAVNPSNPEEVVIGMTSGNLIKSTDGGLNWRLLENYSDRINKLYWQNGSLYMMLKTKGVLKSTDGGATFVNLTASLLQSQEQSSLFGSNNRIQSFNRLSVGGISADLLYITTDRGLFKSSNEGIIWELIRLPLKSFEGSQAIVRAVAVAPSSTNTVYSSVGSTVYKSTDGAQTWQTQSVGTSGFINVLLVHPELAQIAYGGIYGN